MSVLQFVWIGDLDENKHQRLQNPQALFQERCHPMTMMVRQDKKETRIGRKNSRIPPDYALESALSNRMISRNHVTIERLSKGNYMLYDHSLNGTYVNFCRVIGGTVLKNDDIVCFGHINGANIKPGESVTPFGTDLKYRVEIMERGSERSGTRCEQFSDSSEAESAPKIHNRVINDSRKRVKMPKPLSDQSGHSSDSSNVSDNYVKRKNAPVSSSSSSDDDDRMKQSNKDRSIYKKSAVEKPKKHSSSMSTNVVGRHSDSTRNRKIDTSGQIKPGYSKKMIESKRSKTDDDRRPKERSKVHMGQKSHLKTNKYVSGDNKSAKRSSTNANSNYDYEECSAQPCKRPDGENLIDWIMCDKCNQWFHQYCVGLNEALDDDESYYCPRCAHH